jgi:hypothetical protein
MEPEESNRDEERKKRRASRPVVFRYLDPGGASSDESGPGFFASLIDAFLPPRPKGRRISSLSTPDESSAFDRGAFADEYEERSTTLSGIATGVPILPAILFLGCIGAMTLLFVDANISGRLAFAFSKPHKQQQMQPTAGVWVNKQNGTYYCPDSVLYGREPGSYTTQGAALDSGYQPSQGIYCSDQGEREVAEKAAPVLQKKPSHGP